MTNLSLTLLGNNENSTSKDLNKWVIIHCYQLKLIIFLLINFFEKKIEIIDYNRLYWILLLTK